MFNEKTQHKIIFGFIKERFIRLLSFSSLLAGMANVSGHIKCISLNNQSCVTRHTLIN